MSTPDPIERILPMTATMGHIEAAKTSCLEEAHLRGLRIRGWIIDGQDNTMIVVALVEEPQTASQWHGDGA